jgi:hypothetical protein
VRFIHRKSWNVGSLSEDLVMGLRLLRRLPAYLRHPLMLAECRSILQRRLERREGDFLDLMQRAVFANPAIWKAWFGMTDWRARSGRCTVRAFT